MDEDSERLARIESHLERIVELLEANAASEAENRASIFSQPDTKLSVKNVFAGIGALLLLSTVGVVVMILSSIASVGQWFMGKIGDSEPEDPHDPTAAS